MSMGDWIVVCFLVLILACIFWSRKNRKKACTGNCATCHQVDWNKVRCEIHKNKTTQS